MEYGVEHYIGISYFDKVDFLVDKLVGCGLDNHTNRWIHCWLMEYTQGVPVNSSL